MGLSSSTSTSKSSTKYGKQALPHINAATDAMSQAYTQTQPRLGGVMDALGETFAGFDPNKGNITTANGYVGDVLGGKYLTGNPHLQGIIDTTNNSVMDRVNALFSRNGQTGSSRQIGELGTRLAEAENALRYQDYGAERARMDAAVGQAAGLSDAENRNIQTQDALGRTVAGLPLDVASQYAQGMGSLWGNILDTKGTQKTSGGLGQMLMQGIGAAAGAYAASDPALKENIERVGDGPDGLALYAFDYIAPPTDAIAPYMKQGRQVGVMADEVARLRPDALGPVIDGYQTVNYAALGMN